MFDRSWSTLSIVLSGASMAVAVATMAVGVGSCSSVANQRIGVDAPPYSPNSFSPLGDYLVQRCGTLDCHGQTGRNFRVYGCNGMRFDAGQGVSCLPGDAGSGPTTNDEYVATYRSLVGLEPQVMSAVFPGCNGAQGSGGNAAYPPPSSCHPEALTFVAKARGIEKHKGGQLICVSAPCPPTIPDPDPYDPQDQCIVSWLENNTNSIDCTNALSYGFPPPDASFE